MHRLLPTVELKYRQIVYAVQSFWYNSDCEITKISLIFKINIAHNNSYVRYLTYLIFRPVFDGHEVRPVLFS